MVNIRALFFLHKNSRNVCIRKAVKKFLLVSGNGPILLEKIGLFTSAVVRYIAHAHCFAFW